MCDIRKKNRAAIYIFSRLFRGKDIQKEPNVKLMKLIYLVYIKFVSVYNNFFQEESRSPLREFEFYAWEYGGVEKNIYDNISYIKDEVKRNDANVLLAQDYGFQNDEVDEINTSINFVLENFGDKDTEWLVQFIHATMTEWAKTPRFEKMQFQDKCISEINALNTSCAVQ